MDFTTLSFMENIEKKEKLKEDEEKMEKEYLKTLGDEDFGEPGEEY